MPEDLSRDAIFAMVRDHLLEERSLDPAELTEATRFREDLDADSLDLHVLRLELEDVYGVAMSDAEAEKIDTVGSAVDFVTSRVAAS